MSNVARAKSILEQLRAAGVRVVAACAGARNAPLLEVLHASSGFEVLGFFDERSAGFFCLGRSRADASPVAVVTTSGTAAAELLPAVVEAHYAGVPLVVVTADRPRRHRGTGAPQAIEQNGLFGPYVERCVDLEEDADLSLQLWSRTRPIHINSCFDEPLIDAPVVPLDTTGGGADRPVLQATDSTGETRGALLEFRRRTRRPVAIVGDLPADQRDPVAELLRALRIPSHLEAHSGLRDDPRLQGLRLRGGDRFVTRAGRQGWVDGVLRLGGVPTIRTWRDLEGDLSGLPVLSLSHRIFPGLSRTRADHTLAPLAGLETCGEDLTPYDPPDGLIARDRAGVDALRSLCEAYPRSEVALVRELSGRIPPRSLVYLGNSQPIRHWDRAAEPRSPDIRYATSRGANGIDGQLSTFLGMCRPGRPNIALVGDLTALYDASAPWAIRHLESGTDVTIVVLNNGGGGIFETVFGHDRFRNAHDIRFRGWAEQWGLDYEEWSGIPAHPRWEGRRIVEIRPEIEQTRAFCRDDEDPWT
jgi:2-succinyl-5-enolpyruvyl-6-hydroxy-3-cyclohexene-1-carboxylate synthase